jgi:transposase
MPWKASSVMEERLRFVALLLDGEAMTDVCREFGVSRKTGYKIFDRYKEYGLGWLGDLVKPGHDCTSAMRVASQASRSATSQWRIA